MNFLKVVKHQLNGPSNRVQRGGSSWYSPSSGASFDRSERTRERGAPFHCVHRFLTRLKNRVIFHLIAACSVEVSGCDDIIIHHCRCFVYHPRVLAIPLTLLLSPYYTMISIDRSIDRIHVNVFALIDIEKKKVDLTSMITSVIIKSDYVRSAMFSLDTLSQVSYIVHQ